MLWFFPENKNNQSSCASLCRGFEVWKGIEWMFIGGMTNKHIRTGLPNAFFVLWFSLRATVETVLFSIKHSYATWCCHRVSKTRSWCTTHPGPSPPPPPPYSAWLQNMQTERASLDSPVCVPASDASPQLQTNSVCPAHNSSCGLIQDCI